MTPLKERSVFIIIVVMIAMFSLRLQLEYKRLLMRIAIQREAKKKFIYGTNVEEFAADYYCSHLIANSPNDSVQTALPHQLQEHKGAQSAVIKCKVIKENETTWVAAFSEGKLWTDVMKY